MNNVPEKERYEMIARQIDREDSLINYRLTWTLTLNGFLFAALGFLGSKDVPDEKIVDFFHCALPTTGFFVSLAGFLGVVAGFLQINYLTGEYSKLHDYRCVRPFGDKKLAYVLGIIPCCLPPLVLAIVWLVLGLIWQRVDFYFQLKSTPGERCEFYRRFVAGRRLPEALYV